MKITQIDSIVTALDMLATFAFAVVGARIAASRNMDYGGITLIAAVASLSGGTLRNVFLHDHAPWLLHPWLFAAVILGFNIAPLPFVLFTFT